MKNSGKYKNITRRKFMDRSIQHSAIIGLSKTLGLSFLIPTKDRKNKSKTVHGACYHDCPDTCSWKVKMKDNKIISFQGSEDNPYTNGKLCNKMDDFPNDVTFHPDRVLVPLKRTGNKGAGVFEPISWEQALREVAGKLKLIIADYGPETLLPYSYAGTQGLIQGNYFTNRFFAHIGASKLERTICGNAAVSGVMATNGQSTGVLPEDIQYSRFIILWGTNPVVSNQHLWPFIQKAKQSGSKIIVIDPFQSLTALEADWHIQPLPGTDTALALGLINVILAENLQDQDYIDHYTLGLDELKKHVQNYHPEQVAKLTGLKKETIITLAREYAKSAPALIRILIGMEHQANGGSAYRAIAMLPALIGAWKYRGGGLMHMTYELFGEALNWESLSLANTLENPDTRTINMIQIGRALNDSNLAPRIHGLIVYNSNPAVIAPDQNAVIRGLQREDLFTVVLEHFITDTARFADYIFPATTQLEHWDLMDSWGQTYLNLNQPAIPPLGAAKSNTDFFRLLSKEMGLTAEYLYETDLELIKKTLDSDHEYLEGITFDTLLKTGWARLNLPARWMPHEYGNFSTSSGKCEFFNPTLVPPLPSYTPVKHTPDKIQRYPLRLLTIKSTQHFLNTCHANVDHLRKKEGIPLLDMHATDAQVRGIKNGDAVRIFNDKGEVFLTVRIRKRVRPGVVCMPQGFWPSLMEGGSSANALTDDLLTDLGRGGAFQEARVEVNLT